VKPPFKLVSDDLSKDTIECLTQLLDHAKAGHILGVAYGAMYKGRRYIVNVAGECHRNRTFTRGIVADLDEELSRSKAKND